MIAIPEYTKFNVNPKSGIKKLNILMLSADPQHMDDTQMTIIQFAAEVVRKGINVMLLALINVPKSQTDFVEYLVENLGIEFDIASHLQVVDARHGFSINIGDKIMATSPQVFHLARNLAKRSSRSKLAYFIQSLDSDIFGCGLNNIEIVMNFKNDFFPITNSQSLVEMFCRLSLNIYSDKNFFNNWLIFSPCIDQRLYYPTHLKDDKKRLLVHSYQDISKYCDSEPLLWKAIARMVEFGLITSNEWEVHCLGSDATHLQNFSNGVRCICIEQNLFPYENEIRSASLALILNFSPELGYLPAQLAACGVPVVTNTFLTKSDSYLKNISNLFYPTPSTYESIVSALRTMLNNKVFRATPYINNSFPLINLPRTWNESFKPIINKFIDWYNE